MFGVSPAFVFSRYGTGFGIAEFCRALEEVAALGFRGYQGEVFLEERLDEWQRGGARAVHDAGRSLGLKPTQFVAHFMLEYFSSPDRIEPSEGRESLKRVVEIASAFDEIEVLTVPMAAFQVDWAAASTQAWYDDVRMRLAEKLAGFLEIITAAGLRMAVEVLPYSVMGGMAGFLEMSAALDSADFGLNLDTGHAWASGEIVPQLPFLLRDRIFGIHLSDNDGTINRSLAPGRGTIEWGPLLRNLESVGYNGSLDIEIACDAGDVLEEYRNGKAVLETIKTAVRA